MKKITFSIILSLISVVAFSQWTYLNSGVPNYLFSVHFTDTETGYVVGTGGTILKTTNGTDWTSLSSGTANTLRSVYFPAADTGYVVGDLGIILKTTNGGAVWNALNSGTTHTLHSVHFTSTNTGYAAGDSGTIIKTTNGGLTWTSLISGTTDPLVTVWFTSDNTGYAGGGFNLLKTIDGGVTWSPYINSIIVKSICFPDSSHGYLASGWPPVYPNMGKSTDAGKNWFFYSNGIEAAVFSIYFTSATIGYAVGANETIIKTTNGTYWTIQHQWTFSPYYLSAIHFPDAMTGYAVGDDGIILKTTSGGTFIKDDKSLHQVFSIHPNPAAEWITISDKRKTNEAKTISIFSDTGEQVMAKTFSNQDPVEMDIHTLTKGLYMMQVQTKTVIENTKLVIQ